MEELILIICYFISGVTIFISTLVVVVYCISLFCFAKWRMRMFAEDLRSSVLQKPLNNWNFGPALLMIIFVSSLMGIYEEQMNSNDLYNLSDMKYFIWFLEKGLINFVRTQDSVGSKIKMRELVLIICYFISGVTLFYFDLNSCSLLYFIILRLAKWRMHQCQEDLRSSVLQKPLNNWNFGPALLMIISVSSLMGIYEEQMNSNDLYNLPDMKYFIGFLKEGGLILSGLRIACGGK